MMTLRCLQDIHFEMFKSELVICDMGLGLRRKIRVRYVNLGIISMEIINEYMGADEVTKQDSIARKEKRASTEP